MDPFFSFPKLFDEKYDVRTEDLEVDKTVCDVKKATSSIVYR